ncbi:MAG: adenylosuccinate synthase [Chloroflexota bacterium]
MSVIVLVGAQWGDEGKGKIIDLIAEKVKAVVRFSGGDNAGHTVVNPYGKIALHLVPSGIFWPHTVCVIGNGVAVNPGVLLEEIENLRKLGVDMSRLCVSDRAHVIMPYHVLLDGIEDRARGSKAVGTTGRGIGPVFSDKVARRGIRMGELLDKTVFREKLKTALEFKNELLTKVYSVEPLSFDQIYREYTEYAEKLRPYVCEATVLLNEILDRGENVLLEGAQGTLLDPDFGTYPFTTSSSPIVAGGLLGSGIPPTRISHIIGIVKAYCTRVGGGPFPTELTDKIGEDIRERAHEFGATTGRPRRCGWFDAVATRYSTRLNGFTTAALTRLDILDVFKTVKVCVAYKLKSKVITHFPANVSDVEKCEPVYEELPGWLEPTSHIRDYAKMPAKARAYIKRLEELIGCEFSLISIGPARDESIYKAPLL